MGINYVETLSYLFEAPEGFVKVEILPLAECLSFLGLTNAGFHKQILVSKQVFSSCDD